MNQNILDVKIRREPFSHSALTLPKQTGSNFKVKIVSEVTCVTERGRQDCFNPSVVSGLLLTSGSLQLCFIYSDNYNLRPSCNVHELLLNVPLNFKKLQLTRRLCLL